MINLRFHIVSIVAVFLALAIGILTGSTLLDKATVDVLEARQRSLDESNEALKAANDELRGVADARSQQMASFGEDTLDALVPGLLGDDPYLILAARGVDEATVTAVEQSIADAGGSPLGIVWFGERMDLDDPDAVSAAAAALDLDADGARRGEVLATLARGIARSVRSTPSTPAEATATTLAPAGAPPDPAATSPTTTSSSTTTPAGEQGSLTVLSDLVDAGLADWDAPAEGEPGSRTLPDGGLRVVVIGGEGAEVRPGRFVYPLVRALSARFTGLLVGEVRTPRSDLAVLGDPATPRRGAFVDPLRSDDDLAERQVTVDDLDEPFGRLAVVLALAQLDRSPSGSYGSAESAELTFPPRAG